MSEFTPVFEPLPGNGRERTSRPGVWPARLAPCCTRPGEWARVWAFDTPRQATTAVANLHRGLLKSPPGKWEFASRTVDGTPYLYARYLGTGNGAP